MNRFEWEVVKLFVSKQSIYNLVFSFSSFKRLYTIYHTNKSTMLISGRDVYLFILLPHNT